MNKILSILVDDEKESRDRMEKLLSNFEEIELLTAEENPEKAIELIIETKPDIVFLDVEMPRKSGFDVVKEVRNQNVHPTFIFVTGYNQYAIKAIRKEAFDFLLKPVDIDELRDCIERFQKNTLNIIGKKQETVPLSTREKEVLKLLVQGKTSKVIAKALFLSVHTIETHRRNILAKTGLKSTAELISFAYKNKLA